MVHHMINIAKWNELPKSYQSIVYTASLAANNIMQARYDVLNPPALKKLLAGGAQLRPFSTEVMEACLKATNELWAEISAKNEDFKKLLAMMQSFRNDEYLWWQVAEYTYDTFMIRSRPRG
jgi:TRAP-type mannitol/chloroaromatic compound transport system substrate-binding protein